MASTRVTLGRFVLIGLLACFLAGVAIVLLVPMQWDLTQKDPPILGRALQPYVVSHDQSGQVYVAWSARVGGGSYDIWIARGEPKAGDWAFGPPVRVTASEIADQWAPSIGLLAPDRALVIWEDERDHTGNPNPKRGDVFGAEVVWSEDDVIVGRNFRINEGDGFLLPAQPTIAVGNDEVFLGWTQQSDLEKTMLLVRGVRNGESWNFVTMYSDHTAKPKRDLQLSWDYQTERLVALWIEESGSRDSIFMANFDRGGNRLFIGRTDSFPDSKKWGLSAASDGGDGLHVAWSDDRLGRRPGGNGDIFMTVWRRLGEHWAVETDRPVASPGEWQFGPGWQPSVAAGETGTALLSTHGRLAQGDRGVMLDVTYLSLSLFKSDHAVRTSPVGLPLIPPEDDWWSEPRVVWIQSVLLWVWVSDSRGESTLLYNTAELESEQFRVGFPRPMGDTSTSNPAGIA